METRGNIGVPSANPPTPGITGYIPIAFQTYTPDVAPRSSLPGRPSALVVNVSRRMRSITCCVFHGFPVHKYAYGAQKSGSLATVKLGNAQPLSFSKNLSSLGTTLAFPPIA